MFPDAGRIYITATPEEVEPLIAYEEYMFAFQNAYRLSIDPYTGYRTKSDFQLRTDAKKRKLIKWRYSKADRLLRSALICNDQIRVQRIQTTLPAFYRGVE